MSLPSCAAAGQNSTLFMAENTSQTWPPQLCWAQLPLRRTAEMGACLNRPAFFSHQTHFLDHYQLHNSHICLSETFEHGDNFTKRHGLPSSVLPPLHILLSSLLPECSSLNFFFFTHSRPCTICLTSTHRHHHLLSHRHTKPPHTPCI